MPIHPPLEFVHRFVPPTGEPPSRRTLLLLHGTGGDESDLLDLGRTLSPDAALLSPRGRVLENGAPRFFRRLAEGVFDLPDLHRRTAELAAFVRAATTAYHLDPAGVVAVGFSNGANIAASLLLTDPRLLTGAVLLRPMVPFEPAVVPGLGGTSVLIAAGSHDPIVTPAQTDRLAALLKTGGAAVSVAVQPTGHGLVPADVTAGQEWMRRLPPALPVLSR